MASKTYTDDFIPRVRGLLLDNRQSSALENVNDDGTLSLNDAIKNAVPEAIVACYRVAPLEMFSDSVVEVGLGIDANKDEESVSLNSSYVRILSVKADIWNRAVYDIEFGSPSERYDIAKDSLNGTIGTKDDPYVLLQGSRLFMIPFEATSKVVIKAVKCPEGTDTNIDCDQNMYDAACYYCAYLVAMAIGQANAESYRREALVNMGIINNNQ